MFCDRGRFASHLPCQDKKSLKNSSRTWSVDLIQREAGFKTVGVGLHALHAFHRFVAGCSGASFVASWERYIPCMGPALHLHRATELRRAEDVPLRLNLAKWQSRIGHEGAHRDLQETVTVKQDRTNMNKQHRTTRRTLC